MNNAQNPHIEILELQLVIGQLQAQLLSTQAELAKYKHKELLAAVAQVQTALTAAKVEPASVDADIRKQLLEIAALPAERLPSIVTKQAQNEDGTPKLDQRGNVQLLHQDGTPLSVVDMAVLARIEELRAANRN